jgi:hypothetical protein
MAPSVAVSSGPNPLDIVGSTNPDPDHKFSYLNPALRFNGSFKNNDAKNTFSSIPKVESGLYPQRA